MQLDPGSERVPDDQDFVGALVENHVAPPLAGFRAPWGAGPERPLIKMMEACAASVTVAARFGEAYARIHWDFIVMGGRGATLVMERSLSDGALTVAAPGGRAQLSP
jgi:hypothetical protein